jgi:hypothetical protein
MEKKEVEIGNPVTIAGITMIPITEISLHSWKRKGGISFLGTKQPLSVIVISPSEKKAFKVSGEEVPLDELLQELPGIKKLLNVI